MTMKILVTGTAGFIGFHVASALLQRGDEVIGIDNLNDYYDVALKEDRLGLLKNHKSFDWHHGDITDAAFLNDLIAANGGITHVVHLAAEAGARHSIHSPVDFIRTNVEGHVVLLEAVRALQGLKHVVYASTSSVYGANTDFPSSVAHRVDKPVSIYGASKRAGELMAYTYAHQYGIPQTGLRFFTVYGPWGRPDMAPMLFTGKILADEPISVFNRGDMARDFTYIDDIAAGVLGAVDRPPEDDGEGGPPWRVYNLGNSESVNLMDFIAMLEDALGKKAKLDMQPFQQGDVHITAADIETARTDLGFEPKTDLATGLKKMARWYREYYGV